jgi:hypothetical protein
VTVTFVDRKLRIPVILAKGIQTLVETGWIAARVYNDLVAIHRKYDEPGGGVWTVAHAPSGQIIIHVASREEAECFALELLKDHYRPDSSVRLDYQWPEHFPDAARQALTLFKVTWAERRRLALPHHLGKVAMREKLLIESGWPERS